MTFIEWLLGRPQTPDLPVSKKIEIEVTRLTGATEKLKREVDILQEEGERNRKKFGEMIDETIEALERRRQ